MKVRTVLAVVVLLAWSSVGKAAIIGYGAAPDGDGAIQCDPIAAPVYDEVTDEYTLNIVGDHVRWESGHIGEDPVSGMGDPAYFTTDTELDPTVTMRNTIDNDTGIDWTGYNIKVSMNKLFSLSAPTVWYSPDGDTSESGWSGTTLPVVEATPGTWVGEVHYSGGTPIPNAGVLDFSYKMSFVGSVQYCQEMTPIPEPCTLVLLGMAGLGLLVCAWRRRQA